VCPSYGRWFAVPKNISDTVLLHAARFRAHGRLPILSYLHDNQAAIIRSSQPLAGLTKRRSVQDERLVNTGSANGKLLIVDARPTASVLANALQGNGSECVEHYGQDVRKEHLSLPNMHAVREMALASVSGDIEPWNKGLTRLIEGAMIIADAIKDGTTVLVHCSDGWDRTSQLVCLAMLILDPTHFGKEANFRLMIYREWLLAGHKFASRHAHLVPVDCDFEKMDGEFAPIFMQFMHAVKRLDGIEIDHKVLDAMLIQSYDPCGLFRGDCDQGRCGQLT
jgi:myotubularin-related protein 6/7/8